MQPPCSFVLGGWLPTGVGFGGGLVVNDVKKNGNYSIRRRNSIGHMAPLGLTGERYTSPTGQLGLARIRTQAA